MKTNTSNSSTLQWKVCGMGARANILEVAHLKPGYLGFIFYEKSPRNFDLFQEIPPLPENIKKTGVFVNATLDFILKKIEEYDLDAIQLHGEETASFCFQLKSKLTAVRKPEAIKIIKVFSVKEAFDFEELREYESIVNYFLFDTQGKNKGGNGFTFNWELLKEYPSSTPFFLSGGIGIEEIDKIKELQSHLELQGKQDLLYAVDVNSRFETAPAFKDAGKLREFKKLLYQ